MPKKTKKEKLLAQRHRAHVPPVAMPIEPRTGDSNPPVATQFSLSLSKTLARPDKEKSNIPNDYSVIKKDIIKTVIFTSLILISEFLLTKWLPL